MWNEENAKKMEHQITYMGLPCVAVKTAKAPQYGIFYLDCLDFRKYSKKLLLNILEKLSAYNHIKLEYVEQNETHFAVGIPYMERDVLTLAELPIGCCGKEISGKDFAIDWNKVVHILVSGTTGSGKSVFFNTLISSIFLNNDYGYFLMIDPKRVAFKEWGRLPFVNLITDVGEAYYHLDKMCAEMETRYADLDSGKKTPKDLYPIYIFIDELADLMLQTRFECETAIVKLAQKARQVNMHLILATQRPTANVVSGLIKANCDTRICFKVSSVRDSVVVLDHKGGEELLGFGDCIVQSGGEEKRVQMAYTSSENTKAVVEHYLELVNKARGK